MWKKVEVNLMMFGEYIFMIIKIKIVMLDSGRRMLRREIME